MDQTLNTVYSYQKKFNSHSEARNSATNNQNFFFLKSASSSILFLVCFLVESFQYGSNLVPLGQRLYIENAFQFEEIPNATIRFIVQVLGNLSVVFKNLFHTGGRDEAIEMLDYTFHDIAGQK